MFRVLYIDEEEKMHRRYKRYARDIFEVDAIIPHDELKDLIEYILDSNPDAVIVDHNLGEFKTNIDYDGVDVVQEYREIKSSFPVFVLTSYDDRAIAEAEDVNLVYSKSEISILEKKNEKKVTFNDKVLAQIEHYKERIKNAETELLALIEKSSEKNLNLQEEARLLELDTIVSGESDKSFDIPPQLKTFSNAQLTKQLIDVSEELINAIEKK